MRVDISSLILVKGSDAVHESEPLALSHSFEDFLEAEHDRCR